MIIVHVRMCAFPFASQFECVWSQMPMNEQKKLQNREFLKRVGAVGRAETGSPTNRVPSASSEPRETVSATRSAGAVLQRTKVQHDRMEPSTSLKHLSFLKLSLFL